MEIIRALHRDKFDEDRGRFTSDTFKNHPDGGISVVEMECIRNSTGDVCRHIEEYYPIVVEGRPFAYWLIDTDDLEIAFGNNFEIIEKTSITGDKCHYNLVGLKDGQTQKWSKRNCRPPRVYLCGDGIHVQLTDDQFQRLQEFLRPQRS